MIQEYLKVILGAKLKGFDYFFLSQVLNNFLTELKLSLKILIWSKFPQRNSKPEISWVLATKNQKIFKEENENQKPVFRGFFKAIGMKKLLKKFSQEKWIWS